MSEQEIAALLHRAERSIQAARSLRDDGHHDFAISRAYYALFYAVTAALLSRGITRSKHSGVISAFGLELVKSGQFTAADQRVLQAAFQDRNEGDYAGVFPPREKADQRITEAEELVTRIANLLRARPPEPNPSE